MSKYNVHLRPYPFFLLVYFGFTISVLRWSYILSNIQIMLEAIGCP